MDPKHLLIMYTDTLTLVILSFNFFLILLSFHPKIFILLRFKMNIKGSMCLSLSIFFSFLVYIFIFQNYSLNGSAVDKSHLIQVFIHLFIQLPFIHLLIYSFIHFQMFSCTFFSVLYFKYFLALVRFYHFSLLNLAYSVHIVIFIINQ